MTFFSRHLVAALLACVIGATGFAQEVRVIVDGQDFDNVNVNGQDFIGENQNGFRFLPAFEGTRSIRLVNYTGGSVTYSGEIVSANGYSARLGAVPQNFPFRVGAECAVRVTMSGSGEGVSPSNIVQIGTFEPNLTVAFDACGGTADIKTKSFVIAGGTYGSLPTARLSGSEFLGWYSDKSGGEKITASSHICMAYTTLYAHWQATVPQPDPSPTNTPASASYKISYKSLGDGVNDSANPASFAAEDLPLALLPAKRVGFDFREWSPNGGVIPVGTASNCAFTAMWVSHKYDVVFNPNGGTGNVVTQHIAYSSSTALRTCTFKKASAAFVGWSTTPSNQVVYADGEKVKGLSPDEGAVIPLYAQWMPVVDMPEDAWSFVEIASNALQIVSTDMTARVSAIDPSVKGDLLLPAKLHGVKVVEIGPSAFAGCTGITSVIIPQGITNIADSAFSGCTALTNVVVPVSMMAIGASSFKDCHALRAIDLAPTVSIGEGAFAGTGYWDDWEVTEKGNMVFLGDAVLGVKGALRKVVFPDGWTEIPDEMFRNASDLEEVILPYGLQRIGAYAFAGCGKLADANHGIYIPPFVEEIGDYAFSECTKLRIVRFMGPKPEAGEKIYYHAASGLVSGVMRENAASWADEAGRLPAKWPEGDAARAINWWNPSNPTPYDDSSDSDRKIVTFKFLHYNATAGYDTVRILVEDGQLVDAEFPEEPEREDYDFLGWFTKPYGGEQIDEGSTLPEELRDAATVSLYGHWVRNRSPDYDDPQDYGDIGYNPKKAHAYNGYLLDGDLVVGTVQLKLARAMAKRIDGEVVTNVVTSASVLMLGEGKKVSLRGNCVVADGAGAGELVPTRRTDEREMSISFEDGNVITGDFDGYEFVAFRDLFAAGTDLDKRLSRAALDNCGNSFAVVLSVSGSELYDGCTVVLSATISSSGKVKVSGTMPDGTKVSATSQVLVGEEAYYVPVVVPLYAGKRGGFGFLVEFAAEEEEEGVFVPRVSGVSPWRMGGGEDAEEATLDPVESGIGRPGKLSNGATFSVSGDFDPDGIDIDSAFSPDGTVVEVVGGNWRLPKADVVKFSREDESWYTPDGKDYGNPAGLKLSYAAKSGTFKGSFKVYGVTDDGKSRKLTATVIGAVVDGVGYGTATIKKVGAVPIVIK